MKKLGYLFYLTISIIGWLITYLIWQYSIPYFYMEWAYVLWWGLTDIFFPLFFVFIPLYIMISKLNLFKKVEKNDDSNII